MSKTINLLIASTLFSILSVSCGSSMPSQSESVFNSVTSHARFELLNPSGEILHSGKTPENLSSLTPSAVINQNYLLTFHQLGHSPRHYQLTLGKEGWCMGTVTFDSLLIEPVTGALFTLPSNLKDKLNLGHLSLAIMSTEDIAPNYRRQLIAL